MMQPWGHTHVSSALEVYLVLHDPPVELEPHRRWRTLLGIEPPIWGSGDARRSALWLASRGQRVWSWDDYAVVFSPLAAVPPRGLHYRPWTLLELDFAQETSAPTHRQRSTPRVSDPAESEREPSARRSGPKPRSTLPSPR